jgi:hypothetical protein
VTYPLSPIDRRGLAAHVHAETTNTLSYTSLFWALVRDARLTANRDLDTGLQLETNWSQPKQLIWPSSLLYMVLMDQMGTAFQPKGSSPKHTQGFRNALDLFATKVAPLTEEDQAALYALRCSFAHDYSLINIPGDQKRSDLFHLFKLIWTPDPSEALIELPPIPWDGTLGLGTPNYRTVVNLWKFEELAESVVGHVQELARADELELGSGLTPHEFAIRYGMNVS